MKVKLINYVPKGSTYRKSRQLRGIKNTISTWFIATV